jgi:hypothetical protein
MMSSSYTGMEKQASKTKADRGHPQERSLKMPKAKATKPNSRVGAQEEKRGGGKVAKGEARPRRR